MVATQNNRTTSEGVENNTDTRVVLQQLLASVAALQQQNQQLQQQNQSFQAQLEQFGQKQQGEDVDDGLAELQPFSLEIHEAVFPENIREPHLPTYNGLVDPQVHVTAFRTQMNKRGISEALQCKLFSGTLTDSALIWYSRLPPKSVNSLVDILKKFLAQFSARKMMVRQSSGSNSRQQKNSNWQTRGRTGDRRSNFFQKGREVKENFSAEITKERAQTGYMGRDRDKWCEFHKMRGHDTDGCWTLKARIDKIIRDGNGVRTSEPFEQRTIEAKRQCRPEDFLRRADDFPDNDEAKPSDEVGGTISTIAGGFTGRGVTSLS
ncbi:hypothetical protein SESBI_42303 [Sesbania bispinosa]|nr:hypothetical protein SESBI_42303 [Sesbania bispinosa]